MDYRDHIQRAIDYMEDHLCEALTLQQCAAASRYSAYHFVRIFAMAAGMTPMEYVRKRRLTEAVLLVAQGIPANVAAARCGLGTPEGFSRLFRAEHGIPLRLFKRFQSSLRLQNRLALTSEEEANRIRIRPEIVTLPALTLYGYRFPGSEDPAAAVPRAWNEYQANQLGLHLLPDIDPAQRLDYGVPILQAEKLSAYFIGVEAERQARGDADRMRIPPGRYAQFTTPAADQMSFAAVEARTWSFAWDRWRAQTGLARDSLPFAAYAQGHNQYERVIYIPIKEGRLMKTLQFDNLPLPKGTTGFLHTFPSSLRHAIAAGNVGGDPSDCVATTGFAFRIWVDAETMCPSATSIWDYSLMPEGTQNAGYTHVYIGRYWGEEAVEAERRQEAHQAIKASLDRGIPVVAWDLGLAEWGLIIGYDDAEAAYAYRDVSGEGALPYDKLGNREIPMLSVLVLTGYEPEDELARCRNTLRIAVRHARGEEPCDNASGLAAYEALLNQSSPAAYTKEAAWSWKYYLGNYVDLRFFAWQYLEKMAKLAPALSPIAAAYQRVYEALHAAYEAHVGALPLEEKRVLLTDALKAAYAAEREGVEHMEAWLEG